MSPASTTTPDLVTTFRAMATDVSIRVVSPGPGADHAVRQAQDAFGRIEAACTRFDPASPLMVANASPRRWHLVPPELYRAVDEAAQAYHDTDGRFDPRVLDVLQDWGYDRSLPFQAGPVSINRADAGGQPRPRRHGAAHQRPWRPRFAPRQEAIRIGPDPIDLGGIGKGIAIRLAAGHLAGAGPAALVEAGGDIYAHGSGPERDGWRVAVEDPRGGPQPAAVLRIADQACATSSVRIRQWLVDGRQVHHLVDPRTRQAGGSGLLAVTVVADDPAYAEVWSKALFIAGRANVRTLADERGLAALLVDTDGLVGVSRAMRAHLVWEAPRDR